jgi:hypothetical protein
MTPSPEKFAQLLTAAIYKIRIAESRSIKKTIGLVQDEVGYELGREGGSAIEYWRKGNIPARLEEVEALARILVRRRGLDRAELVQFLTSAGHPHPAGLESELFLPGQSPAGSPQYEAPVGELATFIVGPPISHPRQFFGRNQELKRIFGLWRGFPLQNVAVIGPHRAGKTSLLRYLASITSTDRANLRPGQRADWLPQPARYRWVFVDFQDARMGDRNRLLRYLLESLALPIPQHCTLNSFMDIVSQHLDSPAIILMDEIGAGLASPELDQQFWWSLRSLGSNYSQGRLGFVLTAPLLPARLANEHGKPSPFFNIFGHTVSLGPLTVPEARELIASSPRPFVPAEADWILSSSGRWPALLQILCDTYLTALEGDFTGPTWREEGLRRLEPFNYLLD